MKTCQAHSTELAHRALSQLHAWPGTLAFPSHISTAQPHTKKVLKLGEIFNMRRFFLLIIGNPIVCICVIYFIINLWIIYILYCDHHMPTSTTGSQTESSREAKIR